MKFPKLKNKFILAPMEEVTDLPFRLLCRKYGASMCYTPQISAMAILSNKCKKLFETNKKDKPIGLQLFGKDPDVLVKAANKVKGKFDVIDLNFGCPSKKIVKQGYGAALLKEKEKIKEIVEALVNNVKKPITVKMRVGFDKVRILDLVKVIEKAGASAITVHGRTREQKYSGKADWSIIKKVKKKVGIPVIGNGDVWGPLDAERMLKETKCDYVMIGRAAISNPRIFEDILHYFKKREVLEHSKEEKVKLCFEYFKLDKKGSLQKFKMIAQAFTKGVRGSSLVRDKITKARSKEEIYKILRSFINS